MVRVRLRLDSILVKKLLQVGLMLGALGLCFFILVNNRESLTELRRFPLWLAILGLLLSGLAVFFSSEQLRLVLQRISGKYLSVCSWFSGYVFSRIANHFLTKSGTVYRGLMLKSSYDVPLSSYVAASLFVAWINLSVILLGILLLLLGDCYAINRSEVLSSKTVLFGLISIAILLVAPVLLAHFNLMEVLRKKMPNRLENVLKGLLEGFSKCGASIGTIATSVLFSIGVFVSSSALILLSGTVVFGGIGVFDAALFCLVMKLLGLISLTPGNIGVRELVFGLVAASLGSSLENGVLLSLLLRGFSYAALLSLASVTGLSQVLNSGLRVWRR